MALHDALKPRVCSGQNVMTEECIATNSALAIMHTACAYVFNNISCILLSILCIIFIYVLYKSYWSPVLYKKDLTEVGYKHVKGKDRAANIARAQKLRNLGSELPPPYPNGWYALAESIELNVGGVVSVDALGLNLCIYRGEDGIARVVDAYCPHLGANFGVGGTVHGNCIRCPFHQWKFGSDGLCVSIPDVENVPKGISIKTWPAMEVDGAVWFWYDAEGRSPLWTVEEPPQLRNWGYRGRNEFIVNVHVQEIPENGADVAHLNAVHTASMFSDLGKSFPFVNHIIGYHVWNAAWSKGVEDHLATIKIAHQYIIMKLNILPIDVTVQQIGPAHVRLFFQSVLGPLMVAQSITPLAPMQQRVIHRIYTPSFNAPFGFITIYGEAFQFERDVTIWNNKKFVKAPSYVKNDKAIRAFRNWFSQFYSDNSLSFRKAMQNPLDW